MAWYDLVQPEVEKINYLQRVKYDEIVCQKTKNFIDIIGEELEPNSSKDVDLRPSAPYCYKRSAALRSCWHLKNEC